MEDAMTLSSTPVAMHGRACANCARAKAKCIPNLSSGGKCGRCERLNKQCQTTLPVRKHRIVKKPPTRTARLEEKLDGLFSLLKSGAQTTPRHSPVSNVEALPAHLNIVDADQEHEALVDPPTNFFEPPKRAVPSSHAGYPTPSESSSTDSYLSPAEAEELLDFFRTQMLGYFPFMLMPAYTVNCKFRHEHPFLWLCIMAVTSRSTEQQIVLGKEVRLTLGRKMLVESERTLDLLFGILVFTGWSQSHIHPTPIISNLIQLAMALVADLGLNKPPHKAPPHIILNYDPRGCPKRLASPKRTIEERRAVLGVFWLSSVLSLYFKRIDSLRWTPYLEECLTILLENRDCPSDIFLAHQVRLQLLDEKSCEGLSCDNLEGLRTSSWTHLKFHMQSLVGQLAEIKQNMPVELRQDRTLLLHLYSAEHSIHEIALFMGPTTSNVPDYKQTASLSACLEATKKWFELVFQIPPAMYIAFSIAMFTQVAHGIITLYRLLTFEGLGWDRRLARESADLSGILGTFLERLKQVKPAAGLDLGVTEHLDVYNMTATRLQTIKDWWDAKVAADMVPVPSSNDVRDQGNTTSIDDTWLKEIFGMEEYQFEMFLQQM